MNRTVKFYNDIITLSGLISL